jgi:hypothetical protein
MSSSMVEPRARVLDRTLAWSSGAFQRCATAGWSGRLWIGRDWWCFEGASGDSRPHSHLCAQVVAGLGRPGAGRGRATVWSRRRSSSCRPAFATGWSRFRPPARDLSAPAWDVSRAAGALNGLAASVTVAPAGLDDAADRRSLGRQALNAEADLAEAQPIDPRLRMVLDDLGRRSRSLPRWPRRVRAIGPRVFAPWPRPNWARRWPIGGCG